MDVKIPLPRVLVYQNEDCSVLIDYLTFYGYDVVATSKENILKKLRECNYDLCVLDHFKTDDEPNGLKLLYSARKLNKKMPVIFVSNSFDYFSIIEAFNSGTDDYVVRPYNLEELICRIKALLKRCGVKVRGIEQTYKIGNYIFDTELNLLKYNSIETRLTAKESKTLALLCAYKNSLLPKEILLHSIWVDDNYFNKRSLDVHICHLRNYLSQDAKIKINTIRGLGYSLVIDEEES